MKVKPPDFAVRQEESEDNPAAGPTNGQPPALPKPAAPRS
jgi:hypothetical protein